ncbi:hypothetical protein ACJMK2_035444 [Sinanodonta woodiana]|uniref:Beta-microseminoprotein n=1 Tax=Sinanodonta woodiana TaxID=1069815 RepID=A0ABD3WUY7_SINWO
MRTNFWIAVFAVCITKALCFCFIGEIQIEKKQLFSGQIRKYCEFEGIHVMTRAKFDNLDCLSCECSDSGLQCCGIGYGVRVIMPRSGCDVIQDGCDPLFVMAKDHTKLCDTGEPVL